MSERLKRVSLVVSGAVALAVIFDLVTGGTPAAEPQETETGISGVANAVVIIPRSTETPIPQPSPTSEPSKTPIKKAVATTTAFSKEKPTPTATKTAIPENKSQVLAVGKELSLTIPNGSIIGLLVDQPGRLQLLAKNEPGFEKNMSIYSNEQLGTVQSGDMKERKGGFSKCTDAEKRDKRMNNCDSHSEFGNWNNAGKWLVVIANPTGKEQKVKLTSDGSVISSICGSAYWETMSNGVGTFWKLCTNSTERISLQPKNFARISQKLSTPNTELISGRRRHRVTG